MAGAKLLLVEDASRLPKSPKNFFFGWFGDEFVFCTCGAVGAGVPGCGRLAALGVLCVVWALWGLPYFLVVVGGSGCLNEARRPVCGAAEWELRAAGGLALAFL